LDISAPTPRLERIFPLPGVSFAFFKMRPMQTSTAERKITMVTCFLKYRIDPMKVEEFKHYGKLWIDLVNKMGGVHHGYLIPYEGPNNIGYASFSFPSLAAYEEYRHKIPDCPDCQAAFKYARESKCVISYERNFFTPVFEGIEDKARLF
jgi:hypothetical protein